MRDLFFHAAKSARGSVAVEAAIVFPLLIVLLFSLMQVAIIGSAYVKLQNVVRETAREVAVRRIGTEIIGYNPAGEYGLVTSRTCADASSSPTNSAQYLACRRVGPFSNLYTVAVDNSDATGDAFVRLSIPYEKLLIFNIGFLTGSSSLTVEARYVVEDDD